FLRCGFGPRPADRGWFPDGHLVRLAADPAQPGEWLRVEVVARGPRVQAKMNGKTVADFEDRRKRFLRGHLALQKVGRGRRGRSRRIEARELPAPPGRARPATGEPASRVVFRPPADVPLLANTGACREGDAWRVESAARPAAVPLFEVTAPD